MLRLMRFGLIGGAATLLHFCMALLVHRSLGLAALPANLCGFLAAVSLSYFGHRHWTFNAGQTAGHKSHLPRFLLVSLSGLGLSSLLSWGVPLLPGGSFLIAQLCVAVAVPVFTFTALRLGVFRSPAD